MGPEEAVRGAAASGGFHSGSFLVPAVGGGDIARGAAAVKASEVIRV